MKGCWILSGVPGAGKSRWAAGFPSARTVSADHLFTGTDGSYKFDASRLPEAHDRCLKRFLELVLSDVHEIIVDNTNRTVAEIAPYYRVAQAFGYEVMIVRFHVDPAVAAARNVHGVPPDKVAAMANFEALPPHWAVRHYYPIEEN